MAQQEGFPTRYSAPSWLFTCLQVVLSTILYRESANPISMYGIQKRARLSAGSNDGRQVVEVTLGHLGRRQVAISQAEALRHAGVDGRPFSRPTSDSLVLHEGDPSLSGSIGDPRRIFDALIGRLAVVLGKSH